MSISRLALAAAAASFLTTPALAENPSAPPDSATAGDHHMMMHGMFMREERMMLFADMHKATAGMSDDQKRDYRQQEQPVYGHVRFGSGKVQVRSRCPVECNV